MWSLLESLDRGRALWLAGKITTFDCSCCPPLQAFRGRRRTRHRNSEERRPATMPARRDELRLREEEGDKRNRGEDSDPFPPIVLRDADIVAAW